MTLQGEAHEIFKSWFLATQWVALSENETPADRYLGFIGLKPSEKYSTYVTFFRDKNIVISNIKNDIGGEKWAEVSVIGLGGSVLKNLTFEKLEKDIISTANKFLNNMERNRSIFAEEKPIPPASQIIKEGQKPEPPEFPKNRSLKYSGFKINLKKLKWLIFSAAVFLILCPFGMSNKTLAVSLLVGWVFGILNEINSNLESDEGKTI